jgi:hypothetical protein
LTHSFSDNVVFSVVDGFDRTVDKTVDGGDVEKIEVDSGMIVATVVLG